jgi:nucleoside-diphosphate-sugar epimerase
MGKAPMGDNCNIYGITKQEVERVVCEAGGISARIFTLIGLHQPDKFAITGFIRDAKRKGIIQIFGDGETIRSYMHINDCAHWLYQLMLHGNHGDAYNVGSFNPVTFNQLARMVANEIPANIQVLNIRDEPMPVYYPDTGKAERLGLKLTVTLSQAIKEVCA